MKITAYINGLPKKSVFLFFLIFYVILSISQIFICKLFGNEDGGFSNREVRHFNMALFCVCLPIGIYILSTAFPSLRNIVAEKLERSANNQMSPKALGLFRIVFFLFSLKLIWSSKDVYTIINYDETSKHYFSIATLFWLEISALILIVFGVGGKLPYVFNYIYGSLFLHGDVGTGMFNLVSFWVIFAGLDSKYSIYFNFKNKALNCLLNYRSLPLKWPIVLMSIHLGYTITTAGLSKIQDGVWDHHLGFYYTFIQPWIRSNTFDNLLNYKWLMFAMNWLTIISESIALPLLLFRRTRLIGGINLVLMFALLTYPFRIDPIGPFGIVIGCIVIASSLGYSQAPEFVNSGENQLRFRMVKYLNKAGLFFFISWTFSGFYYDIKKNVNSSRLTYPMAGGPFERIETKTHGINFPDVFRLPLLNVLNPEPLIHIVNQSILHAVSPKWFSPFNYYHFVGRAYYKICVEHNGELIEPVKIFNEDGTMNITDYYGNVLQERVLQNRMWVLGLITHKLAAGITFNFFSGKEKKQVMALASFYHEKFKKMGYSGEILIKTRYITIPEKFMGNVKPWLEEPWYSILKYNPQNKEFKTMEKPLPYTAIPIPIKDKIRILKKKNGH